jgi:hypothetical protein
MVSTRRSQNDKKLFMQQAAKHSIALPEGYTFNRDEIYEERLGNIRATAQVKKEGRPVR